MPIRPDIYAKYASVSPVLMNPFTWGKGLQYNSTLGTLRYQGLNDLFGATIVDGHELLIAAWKHAIDTGTTAAVLPELAKTPVTEDELNALSAEKLKDPVFKNSKLAEWTTFARDKYERLAQSLSQ